MCSKTHSLEMLALSWPEHARTESLMSSIFLLSVNRTTPSSSIVASKPLMSAPGAAIPTSSTKEGGALSIESCSGKPSEFRKRWSRRHLSTTSLHINACRAVTRLGWGSASCAISSTASLDISRNCFSVNPQPLRIRNTRLSNMRALWAIRLSSRADASNCALAPSVGLCISVVMNFSLLLFLATLNTAKNPNIR